MYLRTDSTFALSERPTILVIYAIINTPFRIDFYTDTDAMEIDSDNPSIDHLMEDSEPLSVDFV